MNKNKFIKRCMIATAAMLVTAVAPSCDYLNVVPDNTPTLENAFETKEMAERYLHTCYSYLPHHNWPQCSPEIFGGGECFMMQDGSGAMDIRYFRMTAGQQTVADPIYNTWDGTNQTNFNDAEKNVRAYYKAIRDCNIFLEHLDEGSAYEYPFDLKEMDRKRWVAEVKFLKAYFHYLLLRQYGAITIMDKNLPTTASAEEFRMYRDNFDDCVKYIDDLMLEAGYSEDMPMFIEKETTELGRITKPIVYAARAKFLAVVASPLFNGNAVLDNVVDNRGEKIFGSCSKYDVKKWEYAAKACKIAIDTALYAGHDLLYSDQAPTTLPAVLQQDFNIRQIMWKAWNKEHIWGSTNSDVPQQTLDCFPRFDSDVKQSQARNRLAPTLQMANKFYSENGVPIDEDKEFLQKDQYAYRAPQTDDEKWRVYQTGNADVTNANACGTIELHYNREPRFYAAIMFDNAKMYGSGKTDLGDASKFGDDKLWRLQSKMGNPSGLNAWEYFSITGYHLKKLIVHETVVNKGVLTWKYNDFPIIRLADLYLLYAECLNETMAVPSQEVFDYVDKVRERAGLEGVKDSWTKYSTQPNKWATQAGMREIIHRERAIELAFEGHALWDLLRWKEMKDEFHNNPIMGWNVKGKTPIDFYRPTACPKGERVFTEKNYLWPFKESTLDNNNNIVQNYGW